MKFFLVVGKSAGFRPYQQWAKPHSNPHTLSHASIFSLVCTEKRLPYRVTFIFSPLLSSDRRDRPEVRSGKLFGTLEICSICKSRLFHPAIVNPGLVAPGSRLIEARAPIDGWITASSISGPSSETSKPSIFNEPCPRAIGLFQISPDVLRLRRVDWWCSIGQVREASLFSGSAKGLV